MKYLFFLLASLAIFGCNRAAAPVANSPRPINAAQQTNEAQSVLAHSNEGRPPKGMNSNASGPARSSTGDPIDTSKFDEKIKETEKSLKAKPEDEAAKKDLAQAYFERGFALTEERQYASALVITDALKYDPNHESRRPG